jgi:hypothetical protein
VYGRAQCGGGGGAGDNSRGAQPARVHKPPKHADTTTHLLSVAARVVRLVSAALGLIVCEALDGVQDLAGQLLLDGLEAAVGLCYF